MKVNTKKLMLSVGSLALVVALMVGTSAGDISQQPNGINGFFADIDFPQSIADNFVVQDGGKKLSTLEWWGGYFTGNVPLDQDLFTIRIHDDAGGLPGNNLFLDLSNVAADSRVDTGIDLFGVDEYKYTLDLGSVNLDAGVYWLEIINNTAALPDDVWFWETGDLDPNNGVFDAAFSLEAPGEVWNSIGGNDMAFVITNSVIPEPSSVGVLMVLGLVALRRRRI